MRIIIFLLCLFAATLSNASERFYELTIDYKTVNFSSKETTAMAINNLIPGPVLEFNEGDTAVIKVTNLMKSDASIHWHGLLLPQEQDGVPYITYFPIKPGKSFTYNFPISHAGTYWYHSHTDIDEQRGLYGSIVIHPKNKTPDQYDYDQVVVLSDWTDENPKQVLRNLKKDGDWYALKKNSVISVGEYIKRGRVNAWLKNRWQRMEGMDISDVGYDTFLANGQQTLRLLANAKPGERVRLRFINAGASSFFRLQQGEGVFEIIAADGLDVQPVKSQEILMGMAETYDVIVTIPKSGGLQINANNMDGTGQSSIILGSGSFKPAPNSTKPDLYVAMDHSSHAGHDMSKMNNTDNMSNKHDMAGHAHHAGHNKKPEITKTLNYAMLKTREPVVYSGPLREVVLNLTGDMESYNWSFNNTPLSKADKIKINRGEVVRFIFNNESMMHHPLHLHGHFFKVISGNGDYDVLKHTVDVPPMGKVVIEFAANEEKDWLFHCHNLYHAKTGMARVVRYSDYSGNKKFDMAKMKSGDIMDSDWYPRTDINTYENFAEFDLRLSNYSHALELNIESNDWEDTEESLAYLYKLNRWMQVFARVEHEKGEHAHQQIGIRYHLPFSIESELYVDTDGETILELETEFQLTKRIALELGADTDSAWHSALEYRFTPNFALGFYKNEEVEWGAGVKLTF